MFEAFKDGQADFVRDGALLVQRMHYTNRNTEARSKTLHLRKCQLVPAQRLGHDEDRAWGARPLKAIASTCRRLVRVEVKDLPFHASGVGVAQRCVQELTRLLQRLRQARGIAPAALRER